MEEVKFISVSEEDTKKIARDLAEKTKIGDVVILSGDLGSGKTTFSKGFCSYFGISEDEVNSPSFTLVNIYFGKVKIYHLDLYRINNIDYIDYENFIEYIEDETSIKLIEWNKLDIDVPFRIFLVNITSLDENKREINVKRIR